MEKRRRFNRNGCYLFEDWEDQFIIDNWLKLDDKELAEHIGRTEDSVANRRGFYRLSRFVPAKYGVRLTRPPRRTKAEYEAERKTIIMRRLIAEYETTHKVRKDEIKEELKRLSGL